MYSPGAIAMAGKAFRTPGKGSFPADTAVFDGAIVSVFQQCTIYVFYQETHKYTCNYNRVSLIICPDTYHLLPLVNFMAYSHDCKEKNDLRISWKNLK